MSIADSPDVDDGVDDDDAVAAAEPVGTVTPGGFPPSPELQPTAPRRRHATTATSVTQRPPPPEPTLTILHHFPAASQVLSWCSMHEQRDGVRTGPVAILHGLFRSISGGCKRGRK